MLSENNRIFDSGRLVSFMDSGFVFGISTTDERLYITQTYASTFSHARVFVHDEDLWNAKNLRPFGKIDYK